MNCDSCGKEIEIKEDYYEHDCGAIYVNGLFYGRKSIQ